MPQFFDAPQIPVNTWPIAVVTADFNGDGKTDLAVASGNSPLNGGNILLGNGDGTFPVLEGFLGGSIVVGDFNNDGKPDLALSDSSAIGSSSITIHLGNGDGTFQAPVTYTLAASSGQLIVGDFNADGKADMAVANSLTYTGAGAGNGNVGVFLGNGDGTFQSPKAFPAGTSPVSLATGDFNGDGKADLAVIDNDFGNAGYVDVLLGNGDGTFQGFVPYSLGTHSEPHGHITSAWFFHLIATKPSHLMRPFPLRRLCCLYRCSDCYRAERSSSRGAVRSIIRAYVSRI